MTHQEQLEEFKARRRQLLEIYEAGVKQKVIAEALEISVPRVSQLLKQARKERDNDSSSRE